MKNLFTDNRTAGILRMLGTKSGLTVAVIAEQLGVSERTIRNDIRQLNEDLAGSASIEGVQGRYSLRIFDPAAYKKIFEKICNTNGLFMLLAVGIFEEPTEHKGHPVRIIFFMALPEQSDADDMLMIRVYDELLEISRDTDMLNAIAKTQTWPELMRVLYKKA